MSSLRYQNVAALCLIGIMSIPGSEVAAEVLSDNISNVSAGTESATPDKSLARSFATDGDAHLLSTVTLLLANVDPGAAELDLYDDAGLEPGFLIATLISPAVFGNQLTPTTFSANDLPLDANTTYWVVLRVTSGSFDWAWTADNSGNGVGFDSTWGVTEDGWGGSEGGSPAWYTYDVYPTQMSMVVDVDGLCAALADCADLNHDGIRDDNCLWWACDQGQCVGTDIVFADMGGEFGACAVDGTADGNDRFHALNCFSNVNTLGAQPYPCEEGPPAAFNVDAGGQFGSCAPDGVCDGNDAFAALNAFDGTTTCSCPLGGPAPAAPASGSKHAPGQPVVVDGAHLVLEASGSHMAPGAMVDVDVLLENAVRDLRGYQLHVAVTGGNRGRLQLEDITIHPRKDSVFSGMGYWSAFNAVTSQMVAGLDSSGVETSRGAYLATFTFRASADAQGLFTVDLLADETNPAQRTFLFPTPANGKIAVLRTTPAVISVRSQRACSAGLTQR